MLVRVIPKLLCICSLLFVSGCSQNYTDVMVSDREELIKRKMQEGGATSPTADVVVMAENAFNAGDMNKAYSLYSHLVLIEPENMNYLLRVAEVERMLGRFELSHSSYLKILELDSKSYEAMEGRARVYLAEGHLDKAIQSFSEVIEIYPERWQALDGLGTASALKGDYAVAKQCFEKALTLHSSSARVLNNKALSEVLSGSVESAIKTLKEASELPGISYRNKMKIELNLALAYALNRDLNSAEKLASKHLSGKKLYNNMGVYAALAKDKKLATAFLQKSLVSSLSYYDKAWGNLDKIGEKKL